jgi:hypothetical protein
LLFRCSRSSAFAHNASQLQRRSSILSPPRDEVSGGTHCGRSSQRLAQRQDALRQIQITTKPGRHHWPGFDKVPFLESVCTLFQAKQRFINASAKEKMDDDEYGDADDVLAALAAAQPRPSGPAAPPRPAPKIQQPTPQRLDRAPPSNASSSGPPKVVQPTPQALPARGSGSSILVSPRQKGNPVLACLKSIPWEYSDIPADYGLGLTTCALFLRCVSLLYPPPTIPPSTDTLLLL